IAPHPNPGGGCFVGVRLGGGPACPNIFECWGDGTATFMINGERCTRACGFCLVDTRKPDALPDASEPEHVAEAVARMGLAHAVITAVARDDLPDGGAA